MSWFYEVRDERKDLVKRVEGFATQNAALNAGRKKARELKASGALRHGGVGTVETKLASKVPTR